MPVRAQDGPDDPAIQAAAEKAVAEWLVSRAAIEQAVLSTKGAGEKEPVAPNTNKDGTDSPEGRAKNRRVEITIKHQ
ncbi:MAG: hypothetical protein WBG37_15345 [Desulfobacterales bacterium]